MNGILVVDKPAGWTSHDVVAKLRGIYREKRIGHTGTLDPLATGVLVVFLGRATRAVELCENDEKEYVAGLRLGTVTNTQDVTGETLETHPVDVTEEALLEALRRFTGPQSQVPPMYSAVKIGGRKLYELARKGQDVERKPRQITIHALEPIGRTEGDILLRVRCSKGLTDSETKTFFHSYRMNQFNCHLYVISRGRGCIRGREVVSNTSRSVLLENKKAATIL